MSGEHKFIYIQNKKKFQLQRNEIVFLLNSFGRLSTNIYKIDDFKHMLR